MGTSNALSAGLGGRHRSQEIGASALERDVQGAGEGGDVAQGAGLDPWRERYERAHRLAHGRQQLRVGADAATQHDQLGIEHHAGAGDGEAEVPALRFDQLHGCRYARRRLGRTPGSGRYATSPAAPWAPRTTSPLWTSPIPIPAPTARNAKVTTSRAWPRQRSPSAARFTLLSRTTGAERPASSGVSRSNGPSSPSWWAMDMMRPSAWITPGAEMPTRRSGPNASATVAVASWTIRAAWAATRRAPVALVRWRSSCWMVPPRSATAIRRLSPPMSTATT